MVVQADLKIIKIISRSVNHLATTISTEASRGRAAVIALPHWSQAKLIVVDSWDIAVLRPHGIGTLEQQPPPLKSSVDRNDST